MLNPDPNAQYYWYPNVPLKRAATLSPEDLGVVLDAIEVLQQRMLDVLEHRS